MLQAIEAIVEENGSVRLLEPIHPARPMRAILTLLEPVEQPGNSRSVLALLRSPLFQNVVAGTPVVMEATIRANRHAWDD